MGTGVRAQLQQMQKANLNLGIPSFFALYKSPERSSAKTLAVEKEVVLSTPCSGKGNICHGTIYSLSNWIMTLVLDVYNVLGGRERNRNKKQNKQEREKKVETSMFWTALL